LTDETNQQVSKTSLFFIYGGLFFPIEHLNTLDSEIENIRTGAGYNPEDVFKFEWSTYFRHLILLRMEVY